MSFALCSRPAPLFRSVSVLLVLAFANPLTALLPAQVRVNTGPGTYGAYRQRLVELMGESQAIIEEIRAAGVQSFYCAVDQRLATGRALLVARDHLDALKARYTTFKNGMNTNFGVAAILAQFNAAGEDPSSPQFWTRADQEITGHADADLASALARWTKSPVNNCNPPRSTATPPRPRPAAPRVDPLAGLTRPTVVPKPVVPIAPPPFCTELERRTWIVTNVDPLKERVRLITNPLRVYSGQLIDARGRFADRGDTASVRVLHNEIAWAQTTHEEFDALYFALMRLADGLVVIDCTRPRTQERPMPRNVDSVPPDKPAPRVGLAPRTGLRIGAGLEYAYFPQFKGVAGDQLHGTGFTGTSGTTGYGANIGLDFNRYSCGLSGHQNTLTYEQMYMPMGANFPTESKGTLKGTFIDLNCGRKFRPFNTETIVFMGVTHAINQLSFVDVFGNGFSIPGSRDLENWKTNFGVNFDLPIIPSLDLRVGLTHTVGRWSGDADANTRFGAGLQWRPSFNVSF